jgi:hypothetical protein
MNENQSERIAAAFESIASTLNAWYKAEHPDPKVPRDATITRVKTAEDEQKEDLGSTGEPLEEWTRLDSGPVGDYEREFLDKGKK